MAASGANAADPGRGPGCSCVPCGPAGLPHAPVLCNLVCQAASACEPSASASLLRAWFMAVGWWALRGRKKPPLEPARSAAAAPPLPPTQLECLSSLPALPLPLLNLYFYSCLLFADSCAFP